MDSFELIPIIIGESLNKEKKYLIMRNNNGIYLFDNFHSCFVPRRLSDRSILILSRRKLLPISTAIHPGKSRAVSEKLFFHEME